MVLESRTAFQNKLLGYLTIIGSGDRRVSTEEREVKREGVGDEGFDFAKFSENVFLLFNTVCILIELIHLFKLLFWGSALKFCQYSVFLYLM